MNFGTTEIILIVVVLGVVFLPVILFLWTLHKTLKEIRPENRLMQPGEVWLVLIPLFGLVWQFILVARIADSLHSEFSTRNISLDEDRPGLSFGMAYCILFLCSVLPYIGVLSAVAGFVCWIIYWVKISSFRNRLIMQNG